jgi:O-antigen/teichoic acid export membrane protein
VSAKVRPVISFRRLLHRDLAGTAGAPAGLKQIVSAGVWVAVSQLAPFVATGALSVVAGRVLGADLLGQQSLVAFGEALVSSLLVGSLTDASIQSLASRGSGSERDIASLRRWVVAAHTVAGLVAGGLVATYGLVRGQLTLAWLVAGFAAVVNAVGWGYGAKLIASVGWGPVARCRLVAQLAAVCLGIGAVLSGLGVPGIFAANVVASSGLLLVLRRLAPRATGGTVLWFPGTVVRLWGLFAAGEVLTQIVAKRIEFLFLGAYSSGSEIAAYSIAVMVVSAGSVLPAALAGAAMPAVAAANGAGDVERVRSSLTRGLRVTAMASLPLAALLFAAGPSLVTGLYGAAFARAAGLVPLAALSVIVTPTGQLCAMYWAALGKVRLSLWAGAFGGVADLGAAFALVPEHGATGAVLASLAGQAVDAVSIIVLTWYAIGRIPLGGSAWLSALLSALPAAAAGRLCADLFGGLPGAVLGSLSCLVVFAAAAALLSRLKAPALCEEDGLWLIDALPARFGQLVAWPLMGNYRSPRPPRTRR